MRRPD